MLSFSTLTIVQLQLFFLMFARIIAMVAIFPIFGSRSVPAQLKIGFSLFLSFALFGLVKPETTSLSSDLIPYALLIVKELLVGITIGFATTLIFTAISIAGAMIDMQVGFAMARSIDPVTGAGTTVLTNFQIILFTLLFLTLQGHQFLIMALARSFEKIPVTMVVFKFGKLSEFLTLYISNIFDVSVRLAAPITIFILLVSVASGILSRTMPQMNLFVVALPAKIGVGLIGMAMSMPVVFYVFEKAYNKLQDNIFNLLILMT